MKTIVAGFVVFVALVSATPALAQSTDRIGEILTDALGGLLGRQGAGLQTLRGHFIQAKGSTMIVRAEDGKTYAVDMSAIAAQSWQSLALGQPVTLSVKPGFGPQALIATRLEPEQQDRTGRLRETRAFRTAHGTVERVEGSQLTVRITDGGLLPVDVAQLTGEAEFRARDGALLILEPGLANTVVWIEREDRRNDGGRGNILSGLSGEYRTLHGHRVYRRGTTMIFLADDNTTSLVDMSAIGTETWHPIELGQALTLAAKPGGEPNTLIAARMRADPADRSTGQARKRPFNSVQGTVEAIRGSQIRFRTADNQVVRADASRMPGHAAIRVNERGVLTYERGARQRATALWLERAEVQPSAAVGPRTGEYQRIHGYVQSVGWATMSLKADDGRTLTVDTSLIDSQMRTAIREGDLVSVLGKTTAGADQFKAERIEREARR